MPEINRERYNKSEGTGNQTNEMFDTLVKDNHQTEIGHRYDEGQTEARIPTYSPNPADTPNPADEPTPTDPLITEEIQPLGNKTLRLMDKRKKVLIAALCTLAALIILLSPIIIYGSKADMSANEESYLFQSEQTTPMDVISEYETDSVWAPGQGLAPEIGSGSERTEQPQQQPQQPQQQPQQPQQQPQQPQQPQQQPQQPVTPAIEIVSAEGVYLYNGAKHIIKYRIKTSVAADKLEFQDQSGKTPYLRSDGSTDLIYSTSPNPITINSDKKTWVIDVASGPWLEGSPLKVRAYDAKGNVTSWISVIFDN